MKIAVCIKRVPDTAARIRVRPDGKGIDPQGVEFGINPYDELAIETALRLKEKAGTGEVVCVSVEPDGQDSALRKALAMGVDQAVMIRGGSAFDGAATAEILAGALKKITFDLLLFGKQAIDDDAYQVPTMVAHLLGLPRVNVAVALEIEGGRARCRRQVDGGEESVDLPLPCAVSVHKGINGITEARFPSLKGIMAAKKKPIETSDAPAVEPRLEIVKMELPPDRPPARMVGQGVEAVEELVRLLREEAKVI